MSKERIKELSKEAVKLIKEFRKEAELLGDNPTLSIKIKKGGAIIEVEDIDRGVEEYKLSDISSLLEIEMRGFALCSAGLYEAIEMEEEEFENHYKSKTKAEFIKHVGSIKYVQYRCEEIYQRLEAISAEAEELLE